MRQRPRRRERLVLLMTAMTVLTAACTGSSGGDAAAPEATAPTAPPIATTVPGSGEGPVTEPPAANPPSPTLGGVHVGNATEAVELVDAYLQRYVGMVAEGRHDPVSIVDGVGELAAFFDGGRAAFDREAAAACITHSVRRLGGGLFEHAVWIDAVSEGSGTETVWRIAAVENHVVPGVVDTSSYRVLTVGESGIVAEVAEAPEGHDVPGRCIGLHTTSNGEVDTVARDWTTPDVAIPTAATAAGDGDDGTGDGDTGAGESDGNAESQWLRRPGFPADPADPEPIASTGSNTWDLITVDDPSAFACLVSHGQGPEEILASDKSGYEAVADAYLFTAHYTDGPPIAVRVHPEFGSVVAATAEAERFVGRLGQLPSVLRHDIGRFAIRRGTATATASPGEGISMQSENATVRIGDNRLEETLFHEAVHTSLDADHSYQRSTAWLQAQEDDGRFLTEYGRDYPDSEDMAESALYAYALLHHPERFPDGVAAEIAERIPHRIAYLADLFPSAGPSGDGVAPVACG